MHDDPFRADGLLLAEPAARQLQCRRCHHFFRTDPVLSVPGSDGWWLCAPCRESLLDDLSACGPPLGRLEGEQSDRGPMAVWWS